jgi:CRP-like cAMP-binding protein
MHRDPGIRQHVPRAFDAARTVNPPWASQVPRTANRLLAGSLDAWLGDSTETVELRMHQRLADAGVRPAHVFFPEAAVLSVMRHLGGGDRMEVASIGNEGMNAMPLFFGAQFLASDSEVLTAGSARRMPLDKFLEAATRGPLKAALYGYADFLFADMERALVCARFHTIPQQFARWLLQNADRMGRDDFHSSHEFIARRMGVRRATISEAVLNLKRTGIISSGRARIVIQDRARLREVSCACYAANTLPLPAAVVPAIR